MEWVHFKLTLVFKIHWFIYLKIKADIILDISFTSDVMKTDHLISFGMK